MDMMHDMHSRFARDLTQALGTAFRATGVDVEWPVFGADMIYPPPDQGEESDRSDYIQVQSILFITFNEDIEDFKFGGGNLRTSIQCVHIGCMLHIVQNIISYSCILVHPRFRFFYASMLVLVCVSSFIQLHLHES